MFRHIAVAMALCVAVVWSCNYDWDSYDPRKELVLFTSSSGGGASGGSGGAVGSGGSGGAAAVCGDGTIDMGEQCDDGGVVAGDGCDGGCQVECDTMLSPQTGHCYAFLDMAIVSWTDAGGECALLGDGYDLAAISSQQELDWLSSQPAIAAHLVDDTNSAVMWLGGSDTAQEGTWVWSNGEAFFDAWVDGEPNDGGAGGGNGEDCTVYLRRATVFGYDDRPCDLTFPLLCERAPAGRVP